MSDRERLDPRELLDLKDRALAEAAEGITIVDARLPGRPLIYVNTGFERLTGFSSEDALGRNCKFLQGPGTNPRAAQAIRDALKAERDITLEIQNYKRDGTPFWNRLSISPVRDPGGAVTHFIGIQSDVTARREAESALRRAKEQIEEVNLLLKRDLDAAAEIQRAWLPKEVPAVPGYEFAFTYRPCQELGGDSLNIMRLDDDHIGFYVLDVSGHGAPAALYSASVGRLLSPMPDQSCLFEPDGRGGNRIVSPAAVAETLNRQLSFDPETGRFFTLVYGILELSARRIRYATAGHPPPLLSGCGGPRKCPAATGVPIGFLPDFSYGEQSLDLQPGDRLLFFTDGVFEATDRDDVEFGTERLLEAMGPCDGRAPADCLERIIARMEDWTQGMEFEDDVTLLAIDVSGPAG